MGEVIVKIKTNLHSATPRKATAGSFYCVRARVCVERVCIYVY